MKSPLKRITRFLILARVVDGGFSWGRGESSCVNSRRVLFSGKENNGGILVDSRREVSVNYKDSVNFRKKRRTPYRSVNRSR